MKNHRVKLLDLATQLLFLEIIKKCHLSNFLNLNIFKKLISCRWTDHIIYEKYKIIKSGNTMRIQTQLRLENNSNTLRAQIKTNQFGMCPKGYTKIRDYCKGMIF